MDSLRGFLRKEQRPMIGRNCRGSGNGPGLFDSPPSLLPGLSSSGIPHCPRPDLQGGVTGSPRLDLPLGLFPGTPQCLPGGATHCPQLDLPPYLPPPCVVNVSMDSLVLLRQQIAASDGLECTLFELIAAYIWQERVRALCLPLPPRVRLFFLATRGTVPDCQCKDLPKAFYGLYPFNVEVVASPTELIAQPLSYTVKLIQEAKACLVEKFQTCVFDFEEVFQPCAYPNLGNIFLTELLPEVCSDMEFECNQWFPSLDLLAPFALLNVAALFHRPNQYDQVYVAMNNVAPTLKDKIEHNLSTIAATPKSKL